MDVTSRRADRNNHHKALPGPLLNTYESGRVPPIVADYGSVKCGDGNDLRGAGIN